MKSILSAFLFFLTPVFSFAQHTASHEYREADSLYKSKHYDEAGKIFESILPQEKNDSFRIEILVRLGYIMSNDNKIDSSIYYLRKGIDECLAHRIYYRLPKTYNGIGDRFLMKRNFREAMPYYYDALKSSRSADDSVRSYVSMIVLRLKQKNYTAAYSIVNNELKKCGPDNIPYRDFYVYQSKGNYFLSQKKYDSALHFLIKAAQQTDDNRLKANVFNDVAETYRGMNNMPMAFAYQDSAAKSNHTLDRNGDNLLPFYDTYARLYSDNGDFRKALGYADSARHLSDSLFDADKNNASIDADAKYNNQKAFADREIAEKERTITKRNLVITLFGLGIVVLIAFAGLRIARVRKKANGVLTQQKQQVQQLADELAVANETKARLFSTIGHDLRSPVSSLYAKLRLAEIKNAGQDKEMSSDTVQLLDTLEELLVWSKSQMEGFVLQPVNILFPQLLEELAEFYSSSARAKNIHFRIAVKKKLTVKADENILKTILRNAISNAVTYTGSGQEIRLEAEKYATGKVAVRVINPCTEEGFQYFQMSFGDAKIRSRAHGFGLVLMKEFAQKLGAGISLRYLSGEAVLEIIT